MHQFAGHQPTQFKMTSEAHRLASGEEIEKKSLLFLKKNYPKIIRPNALKFIKEIDKKNTKCLLVTASLDIWVKPFAEKWEMQLLSTEVLFENGVFTGKFKTKNCNGKEKVNRIQQAIQDEKFSKKIAFGDTSGDKEMFSWADESFYRFFH